MAEDTVVEGIGSLAAIEQQQLELVRRNLDEDRFKLITALTDELRGWPTQLVENVVQEVNGKKRKLNKWYMNLDGQRWVAFYSFDLDRYLSDLHMTPAFIYERRINNSNVSYWPVVAMLIQEDGKITQASKTWCEKVIEAALNPPVCVFTEKKSL